jgi:hypothetical protein
MRSTPRRFVPPEGRRTQTPPEAQIAGLDRTRQGRLVRILGRAIGASACLFAPAVLAEDEKSSWKFTNPFSPCVGDCTVALMAGKSITLTPATSIFLRMERIENYRWDNSYIVTLSTSRTLVQYGKYFSIDPEIGVGRYHGNAHGGGEAWLAFYLRWRYFPWNDYVRTSIGVGMGPSLASKIGIDSNGIKTTGGVDLANFFSPELELSLPSTPGIGLVIRFHHRSYMWGTFPHAAADADAQFWTAGLRVHF